MCKMATRRLKNLSVENDNKKYQNIVLNDVLCPICRSILIEPVTLPCSHGFCLTCFNGTIENTTLTCPLCRVRIGSWLRSARKTKKVVNDVLWAVIQGKFSKEIRKKADGTDDLMEEPIQIKLATPGEIRREYELQLEKERSELQRQHNEEIKASEIVIKKLLEEDQVAARREAEKQRLDAELARSISRDLSAPSCSKQTPKRSSLDKYLITLNQVKKDGNAASLVPAKHHTTTILCQNRDKKHCSNAYKHLLLKKTLQCERATSNGSDSGDSIKQEMRYFKPIRMVPKSLLKAPGDGNAVRVPLLKVPTIYPRNSNLSAIRSPRGVLSVISHHPSSPFVTCGPQLDPSIIMQTPVSGIKQYYNKRRSAFHILPPPATITSPLRTPFLGFETESNRHVTVLKQIVDSLSGKSGPVEKKSEVKVEITRGKILPTKFNGFNGDKRMQEELDLEFAKRLHEELNNPRFRVTRGMEHVQKSVKTRSRKRQVTLDEFIPPKRFKT